MCAAIVMPALSELLAWPTEHLTDAADHWTETSSRWYEVFTDTWKESLNVKWHGSGAEALRTRTHLDKLKVSAMVDQLQEAAKRARAGEEYLNLNAKLLKLSSELLDCGIPTTITPAPSPTAPR